MKTIESNIAIKLENICKTYRLKDTRAKSVLEFLRSPFRSKSQKLLALKDINFEIKKGEILGIVGNNGSGKSTLLNIILGSITPDKGGKVYTDGKIIRLSLGLGIDRNLSARDNIYLNGSILGLSFKKIGQIFNEIIEFAGIEKFVDVPVKLYSKGMIQRLTFSIAIHAEADIMLLDEFFGGTGDQEFREKSDKAFHDKIMENKTIIIVSHSLNIIEENCQKAIWIEKGSIKAAGLPAEIIKNYRASSKLKSNA